MPSFRGAPAGAHFLNWRGARNRRADHCQQFISVGRSGGRCIATIQETPRNVFPERAVDLELFLAEELVQRRFVRKRCVRRLVGHDVVVLVSAQGRLDINQDTLFTWTAIVNRGIVDQVQGDVRTRQWD
jgi:hypothetical protein